MNTRRLALAYALAAAVATAALTGVARGDSAPRSSPPGNAGAGGAPAGTSASATDPIDVLVFSRTAGFRHASIEVGVQTIRALGEANGFGVSASEDPEQFTRSSLRQFDAVIFLNTTGDVLGPTQQRALRRYVRAGGGYVGIHSAADTEHGWPFYGRLVGTYFRSHPLQQSATFTNEARRNPATAHLSERFSVFDEFYSFQSNPRPDVRVLLAIDESTYEPDPNTTYLPGATPSSGIMGDHPMSWCHDNVGGRVFYTALGHEAYLYLLEWYRRHILGGILIATHQAKARCSPSRA